MPIEVGDLFYAEPDMVPIDVANGLDFITSWDGTVGLSHFIILHEMGHLHNMPTLWEEVESNVNLPAAAVYDLVFGLPIDSALTYSNQQRLDFNEAVFYARGMVHQHGNTDFIIRMTWIFYFER